jgi:hypothetical protein
MKFLGLKMFFTHLFYSLIAACVLTITSHNSSSLLETSSFIYFVSVFSTDPPAVEPAFLEIRQGQDRSVTMSCRVLRAYPIRVLTYEWRLGNKLLRTGQFDSQEYTEYPVKSLSNENYGIYNCSIINEAGAGRCSFLVTGRIHNMLLFRHFIILDQRILGLYLYQCKYANIL